MVLEVSSSSALDRPLLAATPPAAARITLQDARVAEASRRTIQRPPIRPPCWQRWLCCCCFWIDTTAIDDEVENFEIELLELGLSIEEALFVENAPPLISFWWSS